ncbi:copper resistance protein NlpE [Glaesserella sp.]|uniref:copper resistance protein NlpE n=1 Tax=Glaesserella sp. TaxID=2094731 RepID=UPI0035A0EDB2
MKKITLLALTAVLGACSLLPPKTVSGTYQGTLPCADCEKIEAELILNKDNSYQYNTVYYKNKEQHPFVEKGIFTWDANKPNVIRLNNSGNLAVQVTKDYVEFCDANGNTVKGPNNYKLQKVAE